jgi:hypothetical protein
MLEELGLSTAERWVWALAWRNLPAGAQCPNYDVGVIKRNFDPVTWEPSSYVNGFLYNYIISTVCVPTDQSDAVELQADPTAPYLSTVANYYGVISSGVYVNGLSRDDVGGLRYLYRRSNLNVENLGPNVTTTSALPNFFPINFLLSSNLFATNLVPPTAYRPGVDKISFNRVRYNSNLGPNNPGFPFTNIFQALYYSNGIPIVQTVERIVTQPDFIFSAGDLRDDDDTPNFLSRTEPPWDQAFNVVPLNGPGIVQAGVAPIVITFSKLGGYVIDTGTGGGTGDAVAGRWGSFDGSTAEPIVYPSGTSIREIEAQILGF